MKKEIAVICPEEYSSPVTVHASRILTAAFVSAGYTLSAGSDAMQILMYQSSTIPEGAYRVECGTHGITLTGNASGILYGCRYLAGRIEAGRPLEQIEPHYEEPKLPFRGIKFDLPWDTYRHSGALSQHQEVCSDPCFWESFLDMMAENRFNVLTLWNLHPYIYMIRPQNFPEASPWTEREMREWKLLFTSIIDMACERGIDTYLVPFNIFVPPSFAKKHRVALNNLEHHHFVDGDRSEIIKEYTRQCVSQVLIEYPRLSGFGLTLGEGMGGMTPEERECWIKETIIEGIKASGRSAKLLHRIPFSGNTESLGATTLEMEQITRKGIEAESELDFIEGPVWAGMKFNWSHPLSITDLVKVHGGKLYGTYFSPVPDSYKVVWTARNEDIFCLRWGVSEFIREHIQKNSHPYTGGYIVGSETYIPALDYFTKEKGAVSWKYAFQRQWYFYMLWGRLLYDAQTPDTLFLAEFEQRYGTVGKRLFEAAGLAGKTPLRLNALFDTTWDFTLYAEGFMALVPESETPEGEGPTVEFISVDRLISRPPLDPRRISIAEYVAILMNEGSVSDDRIDPLGTAEELETDCRRALDLTAAIPDDCPGGDLCYETADIRIWSYMGLYLACKIRGGICLEKYRRSGNEDEREGAVELLKKAAAYWDRIIELSGPLYREMPLVHLSEQKGRSWRENDGLRFHWELLRPQVMHDIDIALSALGPAG